MRITLAIILGISSVIAVHLGFFDAGSTGAKAVTVNVTQTCGNSCAIYLGRPLKITNNYRRANLPQSFKAYVKPYDAYSYVGTIVQ